MRQGRPGGPPGDGAAPAGQAGVVHPAAAGLAAAVEGSLEDLVSAAAEAIWREVPAYAASADERLREDVAVHVRAVFRVFLDGLAGRHEAGRPDFAITREQATRRLAQGISLADFLQAFRVGQFTLWQGILAAAGDDPLARDGALQVVGQLMAVIELGSTVAGEAYVAAQQHAQAESDRLRRDLLEDLLARRPVPAGQPRAMLRAAGLAPGRRLLVMTAALAGGNPPGQALPAAAAALRDALGGHGLGLTVVRHGEIVGIAPLPRDGAAAVAGELRHACAEVQRQGICLAVGVSTVRAGAHELPEAYAEARAALDSLGSGGGVLALPLLTSFDYLVLRDDETARRLIRPQVARFVADDAAAGGTLIATLTEYAACDLNAKTAARRLHLHVNTAYYRLERIAERTGCDLRRLADVVELLIAIRLLGAGAAATVGPAAAAPAGPAAAGDVVAGPPRSL